MGGFGQARWAEDWSDIVNTPPENGKRLVQPSEIHSSDGQGRYLAVHQWRGAAALYLRESANDGAAGKTNASRVLLRNMYGADLHIGEHIRAYAEFLWGVGGGSNYYGYQTGYQRERLDLQQGILEVKGNLLGAKMGVMGGRQVFLDAPVSMQSARDLTNVQQTWDGFRGYAVWKSFRLDIFDFMQTNKLPQNVFADGTNYNARMAGSTHPRRFPPFPS